MLWRLPVVSIQVVSIQVYSFEVYIVPPACLKEQGYSPKIFFLFTRKLHWKWTKCLCNFTAWVCIEMTGHFAITCYPYSWQVIYLFLEMPLFYAEMCITNSWFTTAGLDHLGKTLFFVYFWSCECSGLSSLFKIMEMLNLGAVDGLFSQFRSWDNTIDNCFFQISSYSPA